MEEEGKSDRYIICSKCRSKYINDVEPINKDFGYTGLEEIYKTCVRCRARNKINCKTYSEIMKKSIMKTIKKKGKNKKNNTKRKMLIRRLKEHDRARYQIKVHCPLCNGEII